MTQTPPPMAPPPVAMPGGQKKAVGIAVAALILGICGVIPLVGILCAVAGIILGIVALVKGTSRKGMAIGGICAGASWVLIMTLLVSILLPSLSEAREKARQIECQTNLHAISRAVYKYSAGNDDWYPPELKRIYPYIGGSFTQQQCPLRCPSAKSGRDCDYFYFASAATTMQIPDPSVSILACDFKDNHGGEGRSVLFADGSVRWMSEEQFQTELQQSYNAAFAKALREAEGP